MTRMLSVPTPQAIIERTLRRNRLTRARRHRSAWRVVLEDHHQLARGAADLEQVAVPGILRRGFREQQLAEADDHREMILDGVLGLGVEHAPAAGFLLAAHGWTSVAPLSPAFAGSSDVSRNSRTRVTSASTCGSRFTAADSCPAAAS